MSGNGGKVADDGDKRCLYVHGMDNHPGAFGVWYPKPAFLLGVSTGLIAGLVVCLTILAIFSAVSEPPRRDPINLPPTCWASSAPCVVVQR